MKSEVVPLTRAQARALCEAGYMTPAEYVAFCQTPQGRKTCGDTKNNSETAAKAAGR